MSLYDPRGKVNRALIVGVSEYDHTGPPDGVPGNLPTVQDNRRRLGEALDGGGVFGEGQITLRASPTLDDFDAALRRAAHEAEGLLLFYFAGHGIVPVDGNELSLQMRTARVVPGARRAFPGAVAITDVLNELASSAAERIVVVLDCCYAGNAARAWQELDPYSRRKILLLMSVQPNRLITASDGGKGTPFTRELVRLLEQQGELTLLALYRKLKERLQVLTLSRDPQEPQEMSESGEDVLLRSGSPTLIDVPVVKGGDRFPPFATPRRIAFAAITCLALLGVAGGVKLIQGVGPEDDHQPPEPTTSSSPALSSSPGGNKDSTSFARLKSARAGKEKWWVGVKRNQPGLSEYRGGKWVGKEIEYAKVILRALGVKDQYFDFRGVGTASRAQMLDGNHVSMFIGTYGISPDRKLRTPEHPPVIFAGPYFRTDQKIMLEHYPGSKEPSEARIRGKRMTVYSIADIPVDARLCVVKGSSAEDFLKSEKDRQKYIEHRTDYNLCIDALDDTFDAVLTDEVILQKFKQGGKYFIAADPFTEAEEYGIGINYKSADLQSEVCKAIRATLPQRDAIYNSLGGENYSPPDLDECD
ncbi:caspase family protein [Streptomyces sp. NPDC002073]